MVKRGPKPRSADAGSVSFNVKPNALRYLRRLVQRSAEFETIDDAAQALFWIGLRRAMETKEFELSDAALWEPDEDGSGRSGAAQETSDVGQPRKRRTRRAE
ncbi:MAG: hypothetical protein DCF16_02900 [Alphaproteobacteria bacterium]|nr:MAG: hypothetical protein DCF16_02900 [Alphaproteobacteria bacterium]